MHRVDPACAPAVGTLVRNTCRTSYAGADAPTFKLLTTASAHQQRALALIQAIQP